MKKGKMLKTIFRPLVICNPQPEDGGGEAPFFYFFSGAVMVWMEKAASESMWREP